MIEVDHKETNSIKSITVKKIEVDVSACFIKRNMLTFAKHSLKNFVCDFVDTFCFPTHKVREIYAKMTLSNAVCIWTLQIQTAVLFFCKLECSIKESKVRNLMLEILSETEIHR